MKRAARDRGLVERPILAPHLSFHPSGGDSALLVSEIGAHPVEGRIYVDVLPLLDGTRALGEVTAALSGRHSALQVRTALAALAARGVAVSAEYAMDRRMAAFWSALGATPLFAEERLAAAPAALRGAGAGRIAGPLADMGVRAAAAGGDAALAVRVAPGYLDDSLAEANRRRLARGGDWIPVAPDGARALFGPVFRPSAGGPCWACLAHRVRGASEAESFLRARGAGAAPRLGPPALAEAALRLAAAGIAQWIVFGGEAPLGAHAMSLDAADLGARRHRVTRRPQCPACGDPAARRPDRESAPVRLASSPAPVRTSGGMRAVPPEETMRRHGHLIDPVSGVVARFGPLAPEGDPWLHVFRAGANLALRTADPRLLRNSLREWCVGKGAAAAQARASALCEAVERRSGVWHGDEVRRRARFADFAEGDALRPGAVLLFSDRQMADADALNAGGPVRNLVPAPFDAEAEMDWTPVWSLTAERRRWLPTQMLYYAAPTGERTCAPPDSNGCAAGNTLEEAVLQGFLELVERDAFACWWYNRARLPEADPGSFADPWLARARERYRARHRDVWLLDATHDLGVPVFVAVSRRTDKAAEDIIYAAGAHFDPRLAALRAVTELNQYLAVAGGARADGSGYLGGGAETLRWWRTARLADHAWLAPGGGARPPARPAPDTADLRDAVEHGRALVEARGMEFLVLDQTRPDIGLPVARTIVPGLRHFWPRFAPGRLYDVPVAMGWRDSPADEADLNPVPVII